jgi:hypothetical protein
MNKVVVLAVLLLAAACAGGRKAEKSGALASVHDSGKDRYAYAPTMATDGMFDYAQVSRENLFDWKTLRLRFQNSAIDSSDGLVFVVDVNIANSGSKAFSWEDYTPFLGIQDEHGEWSYRMLFTQSAVRSIAAKKPVNIRYHTELRGAKVPDQYVVVLQSMFGGRDVGFAFARSQAGPH